MIIPCYLNNRNWLTPLRRMVELLHQLPRAEIIVVDNASTYQPLLDWYEHADVEIIKLGYNYGPRAPWKIKNLARNNEFYVVSDSDLDLYGIPTDTLDYLASGLYSFPRHIKAGLSLEINDLPNTKVGNKARAWEAQFWTKPIDNKWFEADVDTTFAIYRAGFSSTRSQTKPALRAARPYIARHLPWYLHPEKMTNEEWYYFNHTNYGWSSWAKQIVG